MWHVIAAASNSGGTTATGGGAIGTFLVIAVARGLWRQTRVTLPDGRRVTRAEQIAVQKRQAKLTRAYWAEQRRRGR